MSLLKFPAPTAHFPSSAYPHLHSSLLFLSFQPFFQLSPQPSHPFGITSYFLFHFLSQKMFLDPFPKIFGMKPMPLCVSTGHISRGVSSAGSPRPSHQARPGSVNHVRHCPAVPASRDGGNRTGGSCSLWQQALGFIPFSKRLFEVGESGLLFFAAREKARRWREGVLSQQYLRSWAMLRNLCSKFIIHLLFILSRSMQKEVWQLHPSWRKKPVKQELYLEWNVFHFKVKKVEQRRVVLICPLMGNGVLLCVISLMMVLNRLKTSLFAIW